MPSFEKNITNINLHVFFSPEECIVKQSKKRPLWMVWHNPDPLADIWHSKYTILFKNGDGKNMLNSTLSATVQIAFFQSKKDSKDQRLIQSSTSPVPGHQMGK